MKTIHIGTVEFTFSISKENQIETVRVHWFIPPDETLTHGMSGDMEIKADQSWYTPIQKAVEMELKKKIGS